MATGIPRTRVDDPVAHFLKKIIIANVWWQGCGRFGRYNRGLIHQEH